MFFSLLSYKLSIVIDVVKTNILIFFFLKVISNLSLLYKFLPEFLDDETPKDTTTVTKKRGKNTHSTNAMIKRENLHN